MDILSTYLSTRPSGFSTPSDDFHYLSVTFETRLLVMIYTRHLSEETISHLRPVSLCRTLR